MKTANLKFLILFSGIVFFSACAIALAGDDRDWSDRDWSDRGDRIVGLWGTEATVGPCDVKPVTPIRNTLLFHAGGTVVEIPRFGPNGVPTGPNNTLIYQRGQALGTWVYDRSKRIYYIHLRFDNYVDNVYNGYSTVDREITLSNRGMLASGPVRSVRYRVDGTELSAVCGQATSTPL
jgi:hypothetical protein